MDANLAGEFPRCVAVQSTVFKSFGLKRIYKSFILARLFWGKVWTSV